MRPFFKDITEWYFTKNALPYWGILFLDCIGITLSYIVTILFVNMSGTTTMFDNGYDTSAEGCTINGRNWRLYTFSGLSNGYDTELYVLVTCDANAIACDNTSRPLSAS